MTSALITLYNSALYYCCILFFARYILACNPRKHLVLNSLIYFAILSVLLLSGGKLLSIFAYLLFQVLQFFIIKHFFPNAEKRYLIFFYIVLYCFNLIITSVFSLFIPTTTVYIDYIANTITALSVFVVCLSKARHKLWQLLGLTPKYAFVLSGCLLFIAAITATLSLCFNQASFPDVWNRFIQILISFFLLVICTVVPVIFVIAISNTKLKVLTADYEQQIKAQAAHYKELAAANYETRRFRHDFHNMRIALEQLYAEGKNDKAMEVLRQWGDDMNACRPQFDTGNGIADAILTDKQAKIAPLGESIRFDGALAPDTPEPTDLCVILGNTLDNAIEACQKLPPEADKTVSVTCSCCGGFLFLTVRNPIAAPVSVSGGSIATTKDNKTLHGFGLYSLHSVVRKYDGTVKLSSEDNCFIAEIELSLHPIPKKKFSLIP